MRLTNTRHAKLSLAGTAPERHAAFRWLPQMTIRTADSHICTLTHISTFSPLLWVEKEAEDTRSIGKNSKQSKEKDDRQNTTTMPLYLLEKD